MSKIICLMSLITITWGCGVQDFDDLKDEEIVKGFDVDFEGFETEHMEGCSMEMAWWNVDWHLNTSDLFGPMHGHDLLMVPSSFNLNSPSPLYDTSTGQEVRDDMLEQTRWSDKLHVVQAPQGLSGVSVSVHLPGEERPILETRADHFALSEDQNTLATLSCENDSSNVLNVWDTRTGKQLTSQTISDSFSSCWSLHIELDVSHDGSAVAFSNSWNWGSEPPSVLMLTRETERGAWQMHKAQLPEVFNMIGSLVFHGDSEYLSVISAEDFSVVNAEANRVIYDPFKRVIVHKEMRGAYTSGQETYSPQFISPLAWNGEGVEASVNNRGEVELRRTFEDEVLQLIVPPEVIKVEDEWPANVISRNPMPVPLNVAFSKDGTQLFALWGHGFGMWRCSESS